MRWTPLACLLALSAAVAPAGADSWRDAILLYAPMDGSPDAAVARGAAHGHLFGPTSFVAGRRGKALAMPKGASCFFAAAGNANPQEGTLCAWVSLDGDTAAWDMKAGGWYQWLFGLRDNAPADQTQRSDLRVFFDRNLALQYATPKPPTREGSVYAGDLNWLAHTWHHVAVTYKSHELKMYVDGEQRGPTSTGCDSLAAITGNLLIGCSDERGQGALGGVVDEVYVLSRAVTPDEIRTIFVATGGLSGGDDLAAAPAPLLSSPLDGAPIARLADGRKLEGKGVGLQPVDWKPGRALHIWRRSYDAKGSLVFINVPGPLPPRGACGVWIRPGGAKPWDGSERGVRRPIWSVRSGADAISLERSATQELVLSLRGSAQAKASASVAAWNATDAHHLLGTWDLPAGKAALYVDGKLVASADIVGNAPAATASLELWLGADDADNYRGDCADAAFRDLRLFDQPLAPEQIAAIASGRDTARLKAVGLADRKTSAIAPQWAEGFTAAHLNDGVCEYQALARGATATPAFGGLPTLVGPTDTVFAIPSNAPARSYALWLRLPPKPATASGYRFLQARFREPGIGVLSCELNPLSLRVTTTATDGERVFGGTPSTYRLQPEDWHHVAITFGAGGTTSLFIDGVLQERANAGILLKGLLDVDLAPGAQLAEAIGWDRALSEAQVAQLFNLGATGLSRSVPVSDAEKPYWDMTTAYKDQSGGTDRICLNALWRFLPTDGVCAGPPGAEPWGYSRLPGSFSAVHHFQTYDEHLKPLPGETWRDGRGYTHYGANDYDNGWYERTVAVPEQWRGRRISLAFDRIAAYVARIYVDGRLAAHFEQTLPGQGLVYPQRRVDVSDCAGKTIRVSLQIGWDDPGICDLYSLGDAWLIAEDGPVDVDDVMTVTRVRPATSISVGVDLRNSGVAPTGLRLAARLLDGTREALKLTPQAVQLGAGEAKRVELAAAWPGAHLWSPDDPFLYTLQVDLLSPAGKLLKQVLQRVGCREVWIEGRDFMLNGHPVHLRGSNCNSLMNYVYSEPEYWRATYKARKEAGYNLIQYWADSSVSQMGGFSYALEPTLSMCDELGILVAVGNVSYLPDVKDKAAYERAVEQFTRAYGGHASTAFFFVNPNTCWYNYGMHPGNLDSVYQATGDEPGAANHGLGEIAMDTVRRHDPQGRPIFTYSAGNFGPLYSAMQYMSLGLPYQEEADWPSLWAEVAPKPLWPAETDLKWTPHWTDFESYERNWAEGTPILTYYVEHSARYLGDAPYGQVDHVPNGLSFARPEGKLLNNLAAEPYVLQARAMAATDILRGWRGYGMSGVTFHAEEEDLWESWALNGLTNPALSPAQLQTPGPKPELDYRFFPPYMYADRPNRPYYDAFKANFQPVLAFIGGSDLEAGRKLGEFTAKDHAFYDGEEVTKEAVIVNDRTDRTLKGRFEWTLRDAAGKALQSGGEAFEATSGQILRRPFKFRVVAATWRTDLKLELTVLEDNKPVAQDSLALQAYPRPAATPPIPECALLDTPDGKTGKALTAAGVRFVRITTATELGTHRCLIVGEGRCSDSGDPVLAELERSRTLDRAVNTLVLAQRPSPLLNLIFEPNYERYVWPRAQANPVMAGLRADELANWRGASSLAPAYTAPDPATKSAPHYPGLKWHWGNRGIVSTFALRKPTYGNFVPLADDGFDLAFSPLLEWQTGKGRLLLCQLDLADRAGKDPVATNLLSRMCQYAATAEAPHWRGAAYIGSDAGRAYLAPHQLECFIARAQTTIAPPPEVFISEGLVVQPAEHQTVLDHGGDLVLINPKPAALRALGLACEERKVWHAVLPKQSWPLMAGVSPADLYWREERTVPVLTDLPAGSIATDPAVVAEIPRGKGRIIVWTMDARLYDDLLPKYENNRWNTHRAYYAKTSNQDKIHRALSIMFTNLAVRSVLPTGVAFGGDYAQNGRVLNPALRVGLPRWTFHTDPGDVGVKQNWQAPEFAAEGFRPITAPGAWQDQGFNEENPNWRYAEGAVKHPYNGIAWYRVKVVIPEFLRGRDLFFDADCIDDLDETYLNGREIGHTTKETPNYWAAPRHYRLPADLIRFGQENTFAVRVTDIHGSGGLLGKQPPRVQCPAPAGSFSPYLQGLSDYDVNAFHNW